MSNRGQKRTEVVDKLPADKRACSSLEFRPNTASSSGQTVVGSVHEAQDADMDTSSSTSGSTRSEGDLEKESAYGSCDSDYSIHDYYRNRVMGVEQTKFKKVLTSLSEEMEESVQLALLTELCELLSFCSDNSISSLMVDSFSPILVRFARHDSNPDIMLLAIRAITYLCDVNPRASSFLVRHDAVPALCKILMAIEYLDVAEQCLQALLKISREQPLACLQSGAIMAVLSFIDFFSTSVQRLALSAVVNICKKLSSESPSLFMDAVPILCNLLQYEDKPLVESAATCLIKIGEQVYDSSDMLDEICKHGIVQHTIHLMGSNSRTTLCEPTYIGLIGLLAKLAAGSTVAFKTLFELNISNTIKDMLSTFSATNGTQSTPMVDWQHSQIYEILKLLNELLPEITAEQDDQQKSDKEAFLLNHPDVMQKFGIDLLSVLIQVVNSGVNLFICYGCLSIINKLVHFSTSDTLHSLLQTACFSSFLAGVFWRKDHHVVFLALQIVDAIMLKLPHVYLNSFIKEGVLFAINALLTPDTDLKLSPVCDGIRLENDTPIKSVGQDVPRCPCFAYTTQSLKPPENGTCKLLKDTVRNLANHIWITYFQTESMNPERGVSGVLQKLRTLSASLTSVVNMSLVDPSSCQHEEEIYNLLKQIISELNKKDSISTFEFVESGIIKALVYCLSNGRHLADEEENSAPNAMCLIEKRFQIFGRLLLLGGGSSHKESPLLTLIRRLQSALSSVENFPVIPNLASKRRNSYATVPYGHCTSYPCLKVQFVRETESACLRDYGEDVVNVDPFVPIEEIEEYLWRRVGDGKAKQLMSKSKDLKERDGSGSHSQSEDSSTAQRIAEDSSTAQRSAGVLAPIEMLVDFHRLQETDPNFLPTSMAEASTLVHVSSAEVTDIVTDPVHLAEDDTLHEDADNNQPGCSNSECSSSKLLLFLEGQQLKSKLTLYQFILSLKTQTENDSVLSSSLWTRFYKITYRRQETIKPTSSMQNNDVEGCSLLSKRASFYQQSPIFSLIFGSEVDIEKLDPTYGILSLLKCLEGINRLGSSLASRERATAFAQGQVDDLDRLNAVSCDVSQNEFASKKLTEKLEQQMQDPMAASIGSLPSWCTQLMAWCPFLFSFEARCKYFHMAALGRLPIQTHSVSHGNAGGSSSRQQSHGSVPRKKILVHRDKILESAAQMMELHARQKVFVEVEYNEEVGTGLGPTLEFYTLVCREFRKCGLGLWRDDSISPLCTPVSDDENSGLLDSPFGLFPRPWSPALSISSNGTYSDVIEKFSLLGQIVARSLQDGRVLDLPFSKAFYKIMLDKDLILYDIQLFDPAFGKALSEFQAIIERKEYLKSLGREQSHDSDVHLRNTKIEDLCLDFTLPGYPDYALVSDSDSKMVDHSNLEDYVQLIVDATTKSGIARQVDAFKSGFDKVFPIRHLKVFTEEELERLLCGEHVLWNSDELLDHIKFDHGYTISSPPIINLLSIMKEFNLEQQRAFLQFVTGTPRLPIGGLASLNPKLTIVRKLCSKGIDADLPSVMTCANYLKLPPYSSKEVMKEKLMYAITEGQGSFHLS